MPALALPTDIYYVSDAISPDRKSLCVVGNYVAQFIDLSRKGPIQSLKLDPPGFTVIAVSDNHHILISGLQVGQHLGQTHFRLWDGNTGILLRNFQLNNSEQLLGLAISPDGRLAASASEGSNYARLTCWKTDDGTIAWSFRLNDIETSQIHSKSPVIGDMRFSPDGKTIAAGTSGGLYFFRSRDGFCERNLLSNTSRGYRLSAWSRDGHRIVAYDIWGGRIWRVSDVNAVESMNKIGPLVSGLDLSPDGSTVATAGDGGIAVWDWTDDKIQFKNNNMQVRALDFTKDVQSLFVIDDGSLKLLDSHNGNFTQP